MGNHDSLYLTGLSFLYKSKGFLMGQVAAGQNHIVLSDYIQYIVHLILQLAVLIQDADGRRLNTSLSHLDYDFSPVGKLLIRIAVKHMGHLMLGIAGREPHNLCPGSASHFYCGGIDSSYSTI